MMSAQRLERRRLFYALWPDCAAANKLQEMQGALQGRKTHVADFHLTLAFLGEQPAELLPALTEVLLALPLPEMTCVLDTYGYFRSLKLVWAGMTAPPQRLFDIRRELLQRLQGADIPFSQEAAFRPHITLARKADSPPEWKAAPIVCPSPSLVLALSSGASSGPRYQILASRQPSLKGK